MLFSNGTRLAPRLVQAASLQPAIRRHPAGVRPRLLVRRDVRQVPLDDVLGIQLLRHLVRPHLTLQGGGDTLTLDSAVVREAQWVDSQIVVPVPVVPQAPVENPIAGATPP